MNKEYIKHIKDTNDLAWCSDPIENDFSFIDIDHAVRHLRNGGRLLLCPKCAEIIISYLKST